MTCISVQCTDQELAHVFQFRRPHGELLERDPLDVDVDGPHGRQAPTQMLRHDGVDQHLGSPLPLNENISYLMDISERRGGGLDYEGVRV